MTASHEPFHDYELRVWETHASFDEVLAARLKQSPFLLASLGVHLLIALMLAGFLLMQTDETEVPVVEMVSLPSPPEVVDDPPPPDVPLEPTIQDPTLEPTEVVNEMETESSVVADSNVAASEALEPAGVLGLGPGNPLGPKGGGLPPGGTGGGTALDEALVAALVWLAEHQSPEGYWDADEFMFEDVHADRPPSTGPGSPVNDVGLTSLALLAFIGANNTLDHGEYSANVRRGIRWLRSEQRSNGLFGDEVGNATLYNHAIASMAVGEAYYHSGRTPLLKPVVKNAIAAILRARNPYGAWRYSLEPNGDNDSSITGWMVFALKTAEKAGIAVPDDAYRDALTWFDQMTDPATGRTGYAMTEGGPGSRPSRRLGEVDRFPPEHSEALTAVALLCRLFVLDTSDVNRWEQHDQWPLLEKQAELCSNVLPTWDPESGRVDFYYWYYATYALNQVGGRAWKDWKKSLHPTLLHSQRTDGNFEGSWDPVGPWGADGGRVYSTAMGALMLEVTFRYSKVLGGR